MTLDFIAPNPKERMVMSLKKSKRCNPGPCRNWYVAEEATFTKVERCGICHHPRSNAQLAQFHREQELWKRVPQYLNIHDQGNWVYKALGH